MHCAPTKKERKSRSSHFRLKGIVRKFAGHGTPLIVAGIEERICRKPTVIWHEEHKQRNHTVRAKQGLGVSIMWLLKVQDFRELQI